jgi:hypothetical protein
MLTSALIGLAIALYLTLISLSFFELSIVFFSLAFYDFSTIALSSNQIKKRSPLNCSRCRGGFNRAN